MRDLNDARQNAALKRLEHLGQQGNDMAWRDVVATEAGRRVLWLIAAECGWRGSVWDARSSRQSDFNAGMQQAANDMMGHFARLAPADFMLALSEANQRDTEAEQLRQAVSDSERENQENDNG